MTAGQSLDSYQTRSERKHDITGCHWLTARMKHLQGYHRIKCSPENVKPYDTSQHTSIFWSRPNFVQLPLHSCQL